jgi:hypothetical protein
MSTPKGPPAGSPDQRGRRRRARTIDLTATEVAGEPGQPQPAAAEPVIATPAQPEPAPPAPEQPAPQPERVEPIQAEAPRPDHPVPEPMPEPPRVQNAGGGEPPSGGGARPGIAWLPPDFPWPLAGAGAAGVVLALLVVWLVGLFTGRDGGSAAIETRLDPRLARVEQQLRELAARPAPSDPRAIEELSSRLSRLETTLSAPKPPVTDPALANRLAALEGELRALGERDGVLLRRNDEIATIAGEARKLAQATLSALAEMKKAARTDAPAIQRSELDALNARIAALEKTLKSVDARLSKQASAPGNEQLARLLAVATALDSAIMHGRPFVTELDAARPVIDAKTLALLEPFARSGAPTPEMLARELKQVLPAVAKATGGAPGEGGFLDRLKSNAGKIIRVRPIDEIAGDDPAAVLSRIEARAARADIEGALAEFGRLPDAVRAPAQPWIERAKARNAAVEGFRLFLFGMAAPALAKPAHAKPAH